MKLLRMAALLALVLGLGAAQTPDLSGTWKLNVAKSRWGKHPKPSNEVVTIQHHEPALQYSGTVIFPNGTNATGDASSNFAFDGAIDGKPYPATGTAGGGKIAIHRVGSHTIVSDSTSNDGTLTETARMTVSADGKTLIREMRAKGPSGEVSWTEVYDRQ